MKNGSSRVLAYGSLNYNEKYIIWKEHLAGWIESGKLTKEQQNVISELLSVIKPEMWIDNSSKAKTLNSDNVAIIQYKIKQLFTKSLGGEVFASVKKNYIGDIQPDNPPQYYKDKYFTCQCNEGSWASQCSSPGYNTCISVNTCTEHGTTECGFLGLFQCNGDCFGSGA